MNGNQVERAFEFEQKPVRVELFDGEPWWVAKDVALALGYTWAGVATIEHVPAKWRGVNSVQTPSGMQEMLCFTEQGLYWFIARSDKPAAFPFQEWIAGEVLPQIRKTGSYSVNKTPAELLLDSVQQLVNHERRMKALEEEQVQVRTAQQALVQQVGILAQRAAEGDALFKALPAPTVEAKAATTRARVNQVVQAYIFKHGQGKKNGASLAWRKLYREFKARYGIDLLARARNINKKNGNKKTKGLDVAESLGKMEDFYAVAHELYFDK